MSNLKILVVEDEIIVAKDIAARLSRTGYEITGIAANSEEALSVFRSGRPDLVLLDINIEGEKDGIHTALAMKEIEDIPLIFLTALADEDTVQRAKKARPSAYMVKPFNERELHIAIELAINNFISKEEKGSAPVEIEEAPMVYKDFLFVRNNTRFEKVYFEDILWIEAESNYSTIFTLENRYTLSFTLSLIFEKLNHPHFMRVHRSFVINSKKVDGFEESRLFIGPKEIPISKSHKDDFFKRFQVI